MDEPNQNMPTDNDDDEDQCSICLESFTNKALAKDCLHNFCYKCIHSWVQHRPVCPLCLEPVKAIESKLNDTYYVESKKENDNSSDTENSDEEEEDLEDEEEESDWDLSHSDSSHGYQHDSSDSAMLSVLDTDGEDEENSDCDE